MKLVRSKASSRLAAIQSKDGMGIFVGMLGGIMSGLGEEKY